MEERNILATIEDIGNIFREVTDYILNTDNYIFYWITNNEIKDYIEEYPTDFEDRITLIVDSIHGNSVQVRIKFNDEHPHNVDEIHRYCVLSTFRNSVMAKYAEYNGSITELKLKEAEEELEYFKGKVAETEKEIEELKKKL